MCKDCVECIWLKENKDCRGTNWIWPAGAFTRCPWPEKREAKPVRLMGNILKIEHTVVSDTQITIISNDLSALNLELWQEVEVIRK